MGFSTMSRGESVIVAMDANRNRGSMDALNWALNNVVRPKDTVVVLGILCEFGKKSSSCFPFYMGIGISAIWERLEFSGQGEMTQQVLEEEIMKKRQQYQSTLQPFYWQCKKNEVKLEVKLAAGFDPKKITIEEAQNSNTRWVVLDSHLKKDKAFIYERAGCNIAAMKGNAVATIMLSRSTECKGLINTEDVVIEEEDTSAAQPEKPQHGDLSSFQVEKLSASPPPSPCWYTLSWRTGFPRNFTKTEVESITNGFANENIVLEEENLQLYKGILMETPVLVKRFFREDEQFWSELRILSRVHHRNISNLVGYCCTDASMFLLQDYSCNGSLNMHLERDELAKNLSWKARLDIALGIGSCLRYFHEDCLDGPIVHLSLNSSRVLFSHGCPIMLTDFTSAKWLKDGIDACGRVLSTEGHNECQIMTSDGHFSHDIHAYGLLLLELVTGRQTSFFRSSVEGHSLVDWALSLLENGSLSEVIDPRLIGSCDVKEVRNMACATMLCLKDDSGHQPSVSEVLAVVRGDRFGTSHG